MSNSNPITVIVDEARTFRSTWRDEDDELVVVTASFEILGPDGTIHTPSILNPSTGVYETVFQFDEPGNWHWEWTGTTSEGTRKCRGVVCATPSYMVAEASP